MKKTSRIYVAGHTGLVGSALLRTLQQRGYSRLITRTHKALDLTDRKAVERLFSKEKPEYVFLAAARVGGIHANNTYPADFIYQNLSIQTNVIDLAYRFKAKKLLLLASSCIFPKTCKQPMKEEYLFTGPLEPTNEPYAIAKLSGIKMCESYHRQHGAKFISVIPANAYGSHDHFDENGHVLAALLEKFHTAKTENKKRVSIWGTGKPKREFIYVDDLADALIHLMKRYDRPEPINVGTGRETSIAQLARMICKVTGFPGKMEFDTSRPDGNPRRHVDSSNIHALGWKAKTSLEEGLQLTYDWYKNHIHSNSKKSRRSR